MPATLASFSRAAGRSENLPVSKRTSDMLTIKPRAVSRVCRTVLNCRSSSTRNSAFSASSGPSVWPRHRARPGWPLFARHSPASGDPLRLRQRQAARRFRVFKRSASALAAAARASFSGLRRSGFDLRQRSDGEHHSRASSGRLPPGRLPPAHPFRVSGAPNRPAP